MITGIILASGFSNRMGKDKLLIEIEGQKTIERVIKACTKSNLDKVILIYRKEEIKEVSEAYKIQAIENKEAHIGQSQSMKLGIKNTDANSSYMFIVGDQPLIDYKTINRLIQEHKESNKTITIPYYNGKRGMPVIISKIHKDELLRVRGDKGGRDMIKRYPENIHIVNIEEEELGIDIDSNEDLNRLKNFLK